MARGTVRTGAVPALDTVLSKVASTHDGRHGWLECVVQQGCLTAVVEAFCYRVLVARDR